MLFKSSPEGLQLFGAEPGFGHNMGLFKQLNKHVCYNASPKWSFYLLSSSILISLSSLSHLPPPLFLSPHGCGDSMRDGLEHGELFQQYFSTNEHCFSLITNQRTARVQLSKLVIVIRTQSVKTKWVGWGNISSLSIIPVSENCRIETPFSKINKSGQGCVLWRLK